jgi:hypothetical protein
MHSYTLQLHILPEDYLEYYRGPARQVVARSDDGKVVQFPASLLQRFITLDGVHGKFILTCDEHYAHSRLERCNNP